VAVPLITSYILTARFARNVSGTEDAIAADPRLGQEQKAALIAVYRSMLASAPIKES